VRAQRRQSAMAIVESAPMVSQAQIFLAREQTLDLHLSDQLEQYLVRLVTATRDPQPFDPEMNGWIAFGASPRGSIALDSASRAHAWLAGRDYVSPEDIRAVAHDALRHRIIVNYEAAAEGVTSDRVISRLLETVAIP